MTGAFKWPSLLRHFLKCLPNLSLREQPLLPPLDAGCVRRGLGRKTPFSRRGSSPVGDDDQRPSILQLNTQELPASRISIIEQLAFKSKALVIVLQETHCTTADKVVTPNFSLAGSVLSRTYGLAALFTSSWKGHWSISLQSNQKLSGFEQTLKDIRSLPFTNHHLYDSHTIGLPTLNCQHVNWGYSTTSGGESLTSWAAATSKELLHKSKRVASFFSNRWNVGTNPDLAFASVDHNNRLPDRRVLGKFLRPQHRASLITPPSLKIPAYSDPVKRSNFRKAEWNRFCPLTGEPGHNKYWEGIPGTMQELVICE